MNYSTIILCLLLIFPPNFQEDWDKILDKYESLCDECINLKLRAKIGEKVSHSELNGLLSSLSELRKILKDSSGSMSPEQEKRFERIKERYSVSMGGGSRADAKTKDETTVPEVIGGPPKEKTTAVPKDKRIKTADAAAVQNALPDEKPKERTKAVDLPQVRDSVVRRYAGAVTTGTVTAGVIPFKAYLPVPGGALTGPRKRMLAFSLCAVASVVPDFSYGLSFSIAENRHKYGGYVKFRSNFKFQDYAYECKSDGSRDEGSIWTTGNSCVSVLNVSAGARKNFISWLGVYAGLGYGRYLTLWEDVSGNYAKVTDYSVSSVSLEAGVLLDFKPVEITAGVSTIGFKYTCLEVGVGFRF